VKELAKTKNVYVIGGAMLYMTMLPYYDEVLVTKVDADGGAEVFFPNLDECPEFKARKVSSCEDMGYDISFWTYRRVED
jgi:dihydrofolate reductase